MQKGITPKQLTAVHTLLGKAGMKEAKGELVMAFTGGRTDSSRAMSMPEAEQLISHLKSASPQPADKGQKMQNKILSLAHELGWKLGNGKIDMQHVDNWCIKSGYLHKKLDAYSYSELPKLVTQFEKVYRDFIKK